MDHPAGVAPRDVADGSAPGRPADARQRSRCQDPGDARRAERGRSVRPAGRLPRPAHSPGHQVVAGHAGRACAAEPPPRTGARVPDRPPLHDREHRPRQSQHQRRPGLPRHLPPPLPAHRPSVPDVADVPAGATTGSSAAPAAATRRQVQAAHELAHPATTGRSRRQPAQHGADARGGTSAASSGSTWADPRGSPADEAQVVSQGPGSGDSTSAGRVDGTRARGELSGRVDVGHQGRGDAASSPGVFHGEVCAGAPSARRASSTSVGTLRACPPTSATATAWPHARATARAASSALRRAAAWQPKARVRAAPMDSWPAAKRKAPEMPSRRRVSSGWACSKSGRTRRTQSTAQVMRTRRSCSGRVRSPVGVDGTSATVRVRWSRCPAAPSPGGSGATVPSAVRSTTARSPTGPRWRWPPATERAPRGEREIAGARAQERAGPRKWCVAPRPRRRSGMERAAPAAGSPAAPSSGPRRCP